MNMESGQHVVNNQQALQQHPQHTHPQHTHQQHTHQQHQQHQHQQHQQHATHTHTHTRDDVRLCKVDGCTTPARTKGLCYKHGGGKKACSWKECETPRRGGGLCQKHLSEMFAYFQDNPRKDANGETIKGRKGKRKGRKKLDPKKDVKAARTSVMPVVQTQQRPQAYNDMGSGHFDML